MIYLGVVSCTLPKSCRRFAAYVSTLPGTSCDSCRRVLLWKGKSASHLRVSSKLLRRSNLSPVSVSQEASCRMLGARVCIPDDSCYLVPGSTACSSPSRCALGPMVGLGRLLPCARRLVKVHLSVAKPMPEMSRVLDRGYSHRMQIEPQMILGVPREHS